MASNQVEVDLRAYFKRDGRDGQTFAYLKEEEFMKFRDAIAFAVSTLFHPLALERMGASEEDIRRSRQMSCYVLFKALVDMGGFPTTPEMNKLSNGLNQDKPQEETGFDDFEDTFS
jgi:hypothetical protein